MPRIANSRVLRHLPRSSRDLYFHILVKKFRRREPAECNFFQTPDERIGEYGMVAESRDIAVGHRFVPATGHQVSCFSLEHPDYGRIASIAGTSPASQTARELTGIAHVAH